MSYVVVACPRCGRVRGVRAGQKTLACHACGRRHQLGKLRVLAEVDDLAALPKAVQRVSTDLREGTASYQADVRRYEGGEDHGEDTPSRIAQRVRDIGDKRERARQVALLLSEEGAFTLEELEAAFEMAGLKDAERALEWLQKEGSLFEPSPGRYRAV